MLNGVCSGMELGTVKDYSPTSFGFNPPDLVVFLIKEYSWSVAIVDVVDTDQMRDFFPVVIFHVRVRDLGFVSQVWGIWEGEVDLCSKESEVSILF